MTHLLFCLWVLGMSWAQPSSSWLAAPDGARLHVVDHGSRWLAGVEGEGFAFNLRVQRVGEESAPRCTHHGLELEVVDRRGQVPPEVEVWLDAACDTLAAEPVVLSRTPWTEVIAAWTPLVVNDGRLGVPLPPGRTPWRSWHLQPTHLLVLLVMASLWRSRPRGWEPWAFAAAAALLRLGCTESTILLADHAYAKMNDATGCLPPHPVYGPGWSATMGLIWLVSPGPPLHVQWVDLVLSSATVAWVWSWCREHLDEGSARVAASLMLVMPVSVALARTETMFVLVAFLQVAALHCATSDREGAAWEAVCCAALLVLTRPGQVLFAGVVAAAAWKRDRRAAVAVAAVVAAVVLSFPAADATQATGWDRLWEGRRWLGPGSSVLVTDPTRVPLAVSLLAVVGLTRNPRWAAMAFAAAVLPYAHFDRWTDVTRFGLPSLTWLGILAAGGWPASREARGVAWAAVLLSLWGARSPLPNHAAWRVEYAERLQVAEPEVWLAPEHDPNEAVWLRAVTGARWPMGEAPAGAVSFLGRTRRSACVGPVEPIALRPHLVEGAPLEAYGEATVDLGLVRCRGGSGASQVPVGE